MAESLFHEIPWAFQAIRNTYLHTYLGHLRKHFKENNKICSTLRCSSVFPMLLVQDLDANSLHLACSSIALPYDIRA